ERLGSCSMNLAGLERTMARCAEMASPSRSGSPARYTASAECAAFLRSLMTLPLPAMICRVGSKILRKAAHSAEAVYLAGDPDREGEAISAHLALVLSKPAKFIEQEPSVSRFKKKEAAPQEPVRKEEENGTKKEVVAIDPKKIFRVTFNEITPKAIRAAFDKPRQVDA